MESMRYDIRFTGQVQGVGFRYTTQRVAARHEVLGWVRNEPDGSVQCVAEGHGEELDRFVAAVQAAMGGYISETNVRKTSSTGELKGFSIRY